MAVIRMLAQYVGTCRRCGDAIRPREPILWSSEDRKAKHVRCPRFEREARKQVGRPLRPPGSGAR